MLALRCPLVADLVVDPLVVAAAEGPADALPDFPDLVHEIEERVVRVVGVADTGPVDVGHDVPAGQLVAPQQRLVVPQNRRAPGHGRGGLGALLRLRRRGGRGLLQGRGAAQRQA